MFFDNSIGSPVAILDQLEPCGKQKLAILNLCSLGLLCLHDMPPTKNDAERERNRAAELNLGAEKGEQLDPHPPYKSWAELFPEGQSSRETERVIRSMRIRGSAALVPGDPPALVSGGRVGMSHLLW